RMIEKDAVADGDLVTQHVAGLVVAHAIPTCGPVLGARKVIDREHAGFGLHQPVAGHGRGFYHRRRRSRLTIKMLGLDFVSQVAREAYRPRETRRELMASAKGERRCIQQW